MATEIDGWEDHSFLQANHHKLIFVLTYECMFIFWKMMQGDHSSSIESLHSLEHDDLRVIQPDDEEPLQSRRKSDVVVLISSPSPEGDDVQLIPSISSKLDAIENTAQLSTLPPKVPKTKSNVKLPNKQPSYDPELWPPLSTCDKLCFVLILIISYLMVLSIVSFINTVHLATEYPLRGLRHLPSLNAVVKGFNVFMVIIVLIAIVLIAYSYGNYLLKVS